jgi:hypothetical protein
LRTPATSLSLDAAWLVEIDGRQKETRIDLLYTSNSLAHLGTLTLRGLVRVRRTLHVSSGAKHPAAESAAATVHRGG